MDTFMEQIIVRRKTGKDIAIIAGIILGGCVLLAASLIAFMITGIILIPFVVIIGVCYGGFFLLGMRNLEYEYSFTNGDVTVDKIINRRSRKRMVSFDCKDVEDMGVYDEKAAQQLEGRAFDKRFSCGEIDMGQGCWYMDCHSKKHGHVLLTFSPNEDILGAIKAALPYLVRQQAFPRQVG